MRLTWRHNRVVRFDYFDQAHLDRHKRAPGGGQGGIGLDAITFIRTQSAKRGVDPLVGLHGA